MAYNELMKVGFPTSIEMAELLNHMSLESHHLSLGLNTCCLILLLSNGFQGRDFLFGKTAIHFRPGKKRLLDKLCDELKQRDVCNVMTNFKKGFVAFMRRVLYVRIMFLDLLLDRREFKYIYFMKILRKIKSINSKYTQNYGNQFCFQ